MPFTPMPVRPSRNSLFTNLYVAEICTTFFTCGMSSTDSINNVTSPTPTTPITTRSSPSIDCTLYPKCSTCCRTSSISCRVACNLMEIIMVDSCAPKFALLPPQNKKPTQLASGSNSAFPAVLTKSPLAPYVGGTQNRNQYEQALRFMADSLFRLLRGYND